jgi:NAD(P)-dependent dehydrogenase (short-subunit alcohol dehydrogenase family)
MSTSPTTPPADFITAISALPERRRIQRLQASGRTRQPCVNCVAPGAIDTVRGAHSAPLGRMGRSEQLAAMVRQLCLPEGAYITGQTIHVNGGVFLS